MKEMERPNFCPRKVVEHAKENIFKNMSKFQIAGKPGHRASEHLYVLNKDKNLFSNGINSIQLNFFRANFGPIQYIAIKN